MLLNVIQLSKSRPSAGGEAVEPIRASGQQRSKMHELDQVQVRAGPSQSLKPLGILFLITGCVLCQAVCENGLPNAKKQYPS